MIRVSHKIRKHSGGGKFYETVLFEDLSCGASVLVKRFAKTNAVTGGGQILIEDFNSLEGGRHALDKIWKLKGKPNEYSQDWSEQYPFRHTSGVKVSDEVFEYKHGSFLFEAIAKHYSPNPSTPAQDTANTIMDFMSLPRGVVAEEVPPVLWSPTETEDFGSW